MSSDTTMDDSMFADEQTNEDALSQEVFVVKVKGQPFAVGLFWNNFSARNAAASEAREFAARPDVEGDVFCVRAMGSQYGIGRKIDGHAKNMVSLAGVLADKQGGNWIGVFPVETGYYLVAVRDDDILAHTDKIVADEFEARAKVEDLLASASWSHVYAPVGFDIEDANSNTLEDLVDKARAPRMQDTDKVGGVVKWGMAGLLMVGLVVGGMYYMNYKAEMDWQAEQERLRQATERMFSNEQEIEIPPMPWEGEPVAVEYLANCMKAMNRAVVVVPGWDMVGLACVSGTVRMTLDRAGELGQGGGTINWVRWALDRGALEDAMVTPVDQAAVEVTWPIEIGERYDVEITTPTLRDSRLYLQSHFEEAFTPILFPDESYTDYWGTMDFSFNSRFDPTVFASILERIPGLTIDRVILDVQEFTYRVEGSVHEKLEIINANL